MRSRRAEGNPSRSVWKPFWEKDSSNSRGFLRYVAGRKGVILEVTILLGPLWKLFVVLMRLDFTLLLSGWWLVDGVRRWGLERRYNFRC